MKVIVTESFDKSCELVADILAARVKENPTAKLGLATGSTAEGVYRYLVALYEKGEVDFSRVSSVNLDEYRGMLDEHPLSYRSNMNDWLFDHINIDKDRTYVASGVNDPEAEIALFREKLENGGPIDIQLLGVGPDGHLGFNEPRETMTAGPHIEKLLQSTIDANARFFNSKEEVPTEACTMGMGDIMKAQRLVLIANGPAKADAMRRLLMTEDITTSCPVTFLRMHSDATVVIDRELADMVGYKG